MLTINDTKMAEFCLISSNYLNKLIEISKNEELRQYLAQYLIFIDQYRRCEPFHHFARKNIIGLNGRDEGSLPVETARSLKLFLTAFDDVFVMVVYGAARPYHVIRKALEAMELDPYAPNK